MTTFLKREKTNIELRPPQLWDEEPFNPFAEAITVIEERGWTKVHFESVYGEVCMLGAINMACGIGASAIHARGTAGERAKEAREFAADVISQRTWHWTVSGWNDVPWRTKRGALKMLRRMADAYDKELRA